MKDELGLEGRQWPVAPQQEGEDKPGFPRDLGWRYDRSTFVHEGHLENRTLGNMALTRPIAAGESAITALTRDHRGRIFGATSGKRSHLFVYLPGPGADVVIDIGTIGEETAVHRALVAAPDGRVYGGTRSLEPREGYAGGQLFRYSGYHYASEFGYGHGSIELLTIPVPGEGIAALTVDPVRGVIYGLSDGSGTFFSYDLAQGEVKLKSPVDHPGQFSWVLVADREGKVWGARRYGELFCYDPESDAITNLNLPIPSVAGREYYNKVDVFAYDAKSHLIYGSGTADGIVFCFDPAAQKMISLGKPVTQPRVRALTVGADGKVYGIGGDKEGLGHLFVYDPESRDLRDLGIPYAMVQNPWHGYEFESAVTGRWGEIYLGESDRISHLFIYFPPLR